MSDPDRGAAVLRQQFLAGAVWLGIGRGFSVVVGVGVTAVLARLLVPRDYGLVAMAMVFVGVAQQARDFGVGQALIQLERVTLQAQRLAFTLALLTSLALYAVLFLAAEPIARFSRDPQVATIIQVVGLSFPISAFAVVPLAMLRRHLTLRGEAITSAGSFLADSALTIVLAWSGFGVWALVAGSLIGALTNAIGLAIVSPWRPGLQFRGDDRSRMLRFGGGITLSSLLWYAYTSADFLVVGRTLGTSALGVYTMAWNVARMPRDRLWAMLNPLALPLFARARSDPQRLGDAFCKVTSALALVSIPAVTGLAAVGREAVEVLLGPKWIPAVPVLQLFCVFGLVRGLAVLWIPVLLATGRTASVVRFNVACTILLPAGFFVGAWYGITGVALAWAILYPAVALLWLLPLTLRATDLSLRRYLGAIAHPFLASAIMLASVLATRAALPLRGPLRLAIPVVVGAMVYAVAIRAFTGPITARVRSLLQDVCDGFSTEAERAMDVRTPRD